MSSHSTLHVVAHTAVANLFYSLCQRVCKHWCHFFRTSYINTFTKLDFSEARRPVKKTTLKNYITRSRGAVTDVILNRMGWEANETIPYIVSRCKNLSAIQINTDCFVSNSLSAASLIGENLTKIVLECTTTSSCVVDILNNCRKLEILECTNVEDGSSEFWYTTPSPLRRLKLGSQVSRITPVNFRQSIVRSCPPLMINTNSSKALT